MPTSVLRRYTPPTCTLEIAAAGSALSRWTDRTVLKNLRFQLSFDDPKLPPEQQVVITGDRSQLEALCEAVGTYVQALLNQPPDKVLPYAPLQASTLKRVDQNPADLKVAGSDLAATAGIHLQPSNLVAHELWLGTLANGESGSAIRLSVLQLFDLANALDTYHAEALALPALSRPAWLNVPTGWARIAAVAVLALGATGAITKFVIDVSNPTVQTATAPRQAETSLEQGSEAYPRLSPPPALDISPSLALQPVPPPPPVGNTTRPSDSKLPAVAVPRRAAATAPPQIATVQSLPNSLSGSQQQVAVLPVPNGASGTQQPSAGEADTASAPRLNPETGGATADSGEAASRSQTTRENSIRTATASTAFDTIPQVAEVRNYFQQNWQPPTELTQTLEYRLLLNANGSIQRIVPLGQASENYIDRTSMPLMGEPFVSPTQNGSSPQIRLVLEPTGKVKTFLEYAN
jgi:hypothetical protein